MRIVFKSPFFLFCFNLKKLRKAYGICSKVRGCNGYHYLLFDCDDKFNFDWFLDHFKEPMVCYKTAHGHHVIVFKKVWFSAVPSALLECPFIDNAFVSIGIKRGYWFLESPPFFTVKHVQATIMRIER